MSDRAKNVALLLLVVALAIIVFIQPLSSLLSTQPEGLDLVEEAWVVILNDFVDSDKLDPSILSQGAIRGIIESLDDPYSAYLDVKQYELMQTRLEGSFGGIGAEVTIADGQVTVVAPIKDSPAEKEGIMPGDRVIEIDGQSTEDMSLNEAVLKIRGEPGTEVILKVLHRDNENPVEIVVTREIIELDSVYSEIVADDIAYIQVTRFSNRTKSEITSALENMLASGATGIILDLRNNPGGYVTAAVSVASQFLADGIVLYALDNEGEKDVWEVEDGGLATTIPLAVLVNEGSASGSEVVAGALQDYRRGYLIGTKTFGKGSVNHLRELSDGSAIYITIERWYTPNDRQIEGHGIIPDEEVEITEEDIEQGNDPQLDRAIEYIKSQL